MRRPAPLFPERHGDLGLAPSPFLSWPAPPPRVRGKEEHAVERRPSPPPSKAQHLLSPWQVKERSEGGGGWRLKECGMTPPSPSI